jgi:hypothetical protein
MHKRLLQFLGVVLAVLGVLGLYVEYTHLFGLMNANLAMDVLRIGLAGYLLHRGFSDRYQHYHYTSRGPLFAFTAFSLFIALFGLVDNELWGLMPTGITDFDIVFHLMGSFVGLMGLMTTDNRVAHA